MISWKKLGVPVLVFFFAFIGVRADTGGDREWRTWTDPQGNQIEAYLRDVRPDQAIVVRHDGRVFAAPLARFSKADQRYILDWAKERKPHAGMFREPEFPELEVPDRYEIEGLERQRPGAGEPLEPGAIKTILDFHGIEYDDETLSERIAVREIHRNRFIPPRDLINALENLPVDAEVIAYSWDPYAPDHEETWEVAHEMIRVAISMDLPVLVGYRPFMEVETLELVGVATGYDSQTLKILEPTGSSHPVRFHVRDFEFMFTYAMVLVPTFEPQLPPVEEMQIAPAFLNSVAHAIREVPAGDARALTSLLQEQGIAATVRDINRTDYRNMLGETRSFAREGGLPLIDAALNNGRIAVVPQEYDEGDGFALIYGRAEDHFATVEFFPNGTWERGLVFRPDIARNWLTRIDRTYRLDLVQIRLPPSWR